MARDANTVSQVSLSRKFFDNENSREMQELDILEDRRGLDPVTTLTRRDLGSVVMHELNQIERLILMLYYYEEMTMKEIGATLDLSESRVSQMHSAILARLRLQFHRKGELEYDR